MDEEYEYEEVVEVRSGGMTGWQIAGTILAAFGVGAVGYAVGNHAGKKSERKRLAASNRSFEMRPGRRD